MAELEVNARLYFDNIEIASRCHKIVDSALSNNTYTADKDFAGQIKRITKQLATVSGLDVHCKLLGEHTLRVTTFGSTQIEPLPLIKSICKLGAVAAYIEYCVDEFQYERKSLIGTKTAKIKDLFSFIRSLDAQTAMELAITENYLGEIATSIQEGVNVNIQLMGKTLLYHAFLYVDRVISQDILLKNGASPNIKNKDEIGSSPVFRAIEYDAFSSHNGNHKFGYTKLFKQLRIDSEAHCLSRLDTLIEHGLDVDITTNSGLTPLMKASSLGRTRIMKRLIECGANIDAIDLTGMTSLLHLLASFQGNTQYTAGLRLLIDNSADLRLSDVDGRNAMHLACGHLDAEQILLSAGLDYESIDYDLDTHADESLVSRIRSLIRFNKIALFSELTDIHHLLENEALAESVFSLVGYYGRTEIAALLLDNNPTSLDYLIKHSLPQAAHQGAIELCRYIMAHTTEIDKYSTSMGEALEKSVMSGHKQCTKLLIDAGAERHLNTLCDTNTIINKVVDDSDLDIVNKLLSQVDDAQFAIVTALTRGDETITQTVINHSKAFPEDALNQLLYSWEILSPHLKTNLELTKLARACEIAIQNGADINYRGKDSFTPLLFASKNNLPVIVKQLAESNVEIDTQDIDERTALSHAAGKGYLECVKILLEAGANCCIKDRRGFTPFSYAKSQKHKEVMELVACD